MRRERPALRLDRVAARDLARRAAAALRRRPDVLLLAGVALGVAVMVLHWS